VPEDVGSALPYPSANEWILDEVSLWLTLGHIPDGNYSDFSPHHVLQNGELLGHSNIEPDWILCHYFAQNMSRLENWLRAPAPAAHYAERRLQ
jgi:hypothetical protein